MIKRIYIYVVLFAALLCSAGCGRFRITPENPDNTGGNQPSQPENIYPQSPQMDDSVLAQETDGTLIKGYRADRGACVLDLCRANGEDERSSSTGLNVYSAEYIMEVAGLPSFTTQDLDVALEGSRLILASSAIGPKTFSDDQIEALCNWVRSGGIIIAPAITAPQGRLASLFGVSSASYNKTRTFIKWEDSALSMHECSYFDEESEHVVSLSNGKGHSQVESIKTYGYVPDSQALVMASFDSGEAAVVKNSFGSGYAYTFGLLWRDVIARAQMYKGFSATRGSWYYLETSYDAFPYFVRCVWSLPFPAATKFTIPEGWQGLLIPTHDCDSRTAYDEMHWMSEYEASLGLKCHYFMTVHFFQDKGYLSQFYDDESIEKTRQLLVDGHTVGSHSIGHFPDFDKMERFPIEIVDRQTYRPHHDVNTNITEGGSTWGEIVLSKKILDDDVNAGVKAFRSGHLMKNKYFAKVLSEGGIPYSSVSQVPENLASYPFRLRLDRDWSGALTDVLEIPLHFSDVFHDESFSEDNWSACADRWTDFIAKQTANYCPSVLLIHPNRDYKMFAQKQLIENMDQKITGIYNFEEYGAFWNRRRDFNFTTSYDFLTGKMLIQASSADIEKNRGLAIMVEVPRGGSLNSVSLLDETFSAKTTHRLQISSSRYLIVL